tara:strand:- start:668 stop:919 length:252 start_codon:yes stop_codon:yes gene_type:complete
MKELIKKHLEGWQGLEKLSITHFEETGKISGSFFIALKEMIKEDRAEQLILFGVSKSVCSKCNGFGKYEKQGALYPCFRCDNN